MVSLARPCVGIQRLIQFFHELVQLVRVHFNAGFFCQRPPVASLLGHCDRLSVSCYYRKYPKHHSETEQYCTFQGKSLYSEFMLRAWHAHHNLNGCSHITFRCLMDLYVSDPMNEDVKKKILALPSRETWMW